MPRNASGTVTLPTNDSHPAAPRNVIRSSDFNELMADITTELTDSLSRSGKGKMLADIDMDGFDVLNAPNLATAAQGALADSALQPSDIGTTAGTVAAGDDARIVRSDIAYTYDKEIFLQNIPGFDPTGATDSSTALLALQTAHASTGFHFRVPRGAKFRLDSDLVLNYGQKLSGEFIPNDATGVGYDYASLGYSIRLHGGAEIRLDNASALEGLLIYRNGLTFNVDQGDFSTWAGNGVVLGFGNDQNFKRCMVLGFDTCVRTVNDRGLNGPGRVIMEHIYVDGKNGFLINGSYDNAYFDMLRGFCFVTQAYAGTPAPGEGYDPRKDRRPGVGFKLTDRADGTSLGRLQFIGYKTNYDINVGSFDATVMMSDYFTTPTYTAPSDTIGILLHLDTDTISDPDRDVDAFPTGIGYLHAWSSYVPLKIVGRAQRPVQVSEASIINSFSDAIQIDGGGLICPNLTVGLCSGAPVNFLSAPNTKTYIRGQATQFGASRDSNNVPAVKTPAGSNVNLIDVKLESDQTTGAAYFDNHPSAPSVASADPLLLPSYHGNEIESFTVTGTANIASMYGLRTGVVRLTFQSALTLFAGGFAGGLRLQNNVSDLTVKAGTTAVFSYDKTLDRWIMLSISDPVRFDFYGSTGTVPAGATRYMGAGQVQSGEELTYECIPRASTVKKAFIRVTGAPGASQTFTYTLRKNGVDTAMTGTISGAAAFSVTLTHAGISFAVNDLMAMKVVSSAGAAVVFHTCVITADSQ